MTQFINPKNPASTLSFYHADYNIGCGGTETPILHQNRTYLYVLNRKNRTHEYYCWETDMFMSDKECPWYK